MNSTKYIFKALLLLIGVLGFGGVGPINNHNLNIKPPLPPLPPPLVDFWEYKI